MKQYAFLRVIWFHVSLVFLAIGSAAQMEAQSDGWVDAEAETASGTAKASYNFLAAERARIATSRYALVKFDVGTFGEGLANNGTVLIRTYSGWYRSRGGIRMDLNIPSGAEFQIKNMNRNGAVLGYSSEQVQSDFSCLYTDRGWYWDPDQTIASEVNNPITVRAFDECGGGDWDTKLFSPLIIDEGNGIWADIYYEVDPDYQSGRVGLARWHVPSGSPEQIGYDNGDPLGRTYIGLEDVNVSGTMIGWRIIPSSGSEYFVGNQAVDFYPIAINDTGWVIGIDFSYEGGVLWQDGVTHRLNGFYPEHINARGDIVGDTMDGPVLLSVDILPQVMDALDFDYSPFLIQNMVSPGWEVYDVVSINDVGAMVGTGLYSDPSLDSGDFEIRAFALFPARLRVDFNRDGNINRTEAGDNPDLELVRKELPWFFWINDDSDSGETDGDDIPDSSHPNSGDNEVNGMRDLVDFFPVYLDIASLLHAFPPDNQAITYHMVQADGALRFLTTESIPDEAGAYNRDATIAAVLSNRPSTLVTSTGVPIDRSFLAKILGEDKGVLLFEALKPTQSPLRLEIQRDGNPVAEVSMPLSIAPVEAMFRHINLSGALSMAPRTFSRSGAPNWSDKLENKQAFLFVHGYNVNQQQARGWQAEFFKRLWWSGSRAQFWGVTWYGSESQVPVAHFTPNYHLNAIHAFGTAPQLADFVATLKVAGEFTKINVAAHSLGNMVVSSAISDYGAPVDRYFMIDAAVAAEAYDSQVVQPDDDTALMPHTEWNRERGGVYPPRLWATNWHKLFQALPGDARARLTWQDRFAPNSSTDYYDFHSAGEEVLGFDEEHPENTPTLTGLLASEVKTFLHNILPRRNNQPQGTKTWVYQEQLKGRTTTGKVLGSNYGGWGFNKYLFKKTPTPDGRGPRLAAIDLTPTEAMAAAPYFLDSDLRAEPFFRPGGFWTKVATWQYDPATKTNSWSKERLRELYEPTAGSAFAFRHRDALLVRMIPAMSPAAGLIPVPRLKPQGDPEEHNFDMSSPVIRGPAESWPLPPVRNDNKWRHSDLREVAYPYVRGLYDMIAEKGNLKDNLKGINP